MGDSATTDAIDGQPLDVAVETVLAERDVEDAERVRETLQQVTEDGVVTRRAAADAQAHLSKVVATPETRVEVADRALADARRTASPYDDEPVVRTRLDRFEDRLERVRGRSGRLGDRLQEILDSEDLYETALGIRSLEAAANSVQTAADDLLLDVQQFESWMTDPDSRYDRLEQDAALLEEAVDDLMAELDRLADGETEDAARKWAEAAMRHRTLELMRSDLRWELAGARRLDERQGVDRNGTAVEQQIERITDRLSTAEDRIDGIGAPGVADVYEEQVRALDRILDEKNPPVSWKVVRDVVEHHREAM